MGSEARANNDNNSIHLQIIEAAQSQTAIVGTRPNGQRNALEVRRGIWRNKAGGRAHGIAVLVGGRAALRSLLRGLVPLAGQGMGLRLPRGGIHAGAIGTGDGHGARLRLALPEVDSLLHL